jgi:hypothetical protein
VNLLLALVLMFSHHIPWVLSYHCEWNRDVCEYADDYNGSQKKSFRSKQQAIDWAQGNYTYVPENLTHGDDVFLCHVKYLSMDDPDPVTTYRKEVTCELTQ